MPSSVAELGTNETIYQILEGGAVPPVPNWLVDVRDVAKGHILVMEASNLPADKKRFIINAGTYTWKEAVEHLKKTRPAVRNRIQPLDQIEDLPAPSSHLDNTRAGELLGLVEYIPQEKMLEDAVDDLLMLEKMWAGGN